MEYCYKPVLILCFVFKITCKTTKCKINNLPFFWPIFVFWTPNFNTVICICVCLWIKIVKLWPETSCLLVHWHCFRLQILFCLHVKTSSYLDNYGCVTQKGSFPIRVLHFVLKLIHIVAHIISTICVTTFVFTITLFKW